MSFKSIQNLELCIIHGVAANNATYTFPAVAIILLSIALVVGLSEKRRASIFLGLFILALVCTHILQIFIFTQQQQLYRHFISLFAFIPMRYVAEPVPQWAPGGWPAYLWTPFTYSLLHFNGTHLFNNCLALFIFGRTVAWRVGMVGFVSLFFLAGAAGAFLHLIGNWGSNVPLMGASAGAFGILGATFRFVPKADDRLKALFWPDETIRHLPLSSFGELFSERRSLVYILVCITIYPLGVIALLAGTSGNVAVLAHVGGFVLGLLGIGYFDRRKSDVQSSFLDEIGGAKQSQSLGMKLLRFIAFVMMIVGLILGVLTYYLPFLS